MTGLIIDSFAGGGGASTGIFMALGRSPDIAVNHDAEALAMHAANHPETKHIVKNVWQVDWADEVRNRPVDLAWFSPDCKHFSKAKGGRPVKRSIRDLAWVVISAARQVRPRIIMLENVEEFRGWGPLKQNDKGEWVPDGDRKGQTFKRWTGELKRLGYRIEWRELRACDYGAPTIRKRFFMIARRDGCRIAWPEPTHGDPKSEDVKSGRLKPWRTAAEIIDWSLPCHSIFLTREEGRALGVKRPLEPATIARIAKGMQRYVIDAAEPFIVNLTHQGGDRTETVSEPFKTVTGAHRGEKAVVAPVFTYAQQGGAVRDSAEPLHTVTASRKDNNGVIVPTLIQTGYGERAGQEPRVPGLEKPLGTAVAGGIKHALVAAHLTKFRANSVGASMDEPAPTVTANSFIKRPGGAPPIGVVAAFLAQHNIDGRTGEGNPGRSADAPVSTVTATGAQQGVVMADINVPTFAEWYAATKSLGGSREEYDKLYGPDSGYIAAHMLDMHGSDMRMAGADEPVRALTAQGFHAAQVSAFLTKYYGTGGQHAGADDPLHTASTKARFGLVTVEIDGEPYIIADIGMRMLSPRELFRAQGFPDSYIIDPVVNAKRLTKTAQIRMCGNSVCPQVAEALVRANFASTIPYVRRTRHIAKVPLFEQVAA